jgi:hypothetical protein
VGTAGTGHDVNFYGADSSRMFWDESKMALRAGDDPSDYWSDANTGHCSVALGRYVMASGSGAFAAGGYAEASGLYSVAMGEAAEAEGRASVALGSHTGAREDYSVVLGNYAGATHGDVAIGTYAIASAGSSFVMGRGAGLSDPLVNRVPNSLMVGFGSTEAGLFVGGPNNYVGIGKDEPLTRCHVRSADISLGSEELHADVLVVEDDNAIIGLYSSEGGPAGSAVTFGEVTGGELVDKWAIVRETTDGVSGGGSGLRFTFGTKKDQFQNSIMMYLDDTGKVGIGTKSFGTEKFRVNGSACASEWNTCSDLRFKENIESIESALDKVLGL